MSTATNSPAAPSAKPRFDFQAEAIDLHLLRSEKSLHDALRNAQAAGYGDQIRIAITQAIEQVTFVRGQLG